MRTFWMLGALLAAGCVDKGDDTAAGDDSGGDSGGDSATEDSDDSGDGGDDSGSGGGDTSGDSGDSGGGDSGGGDTSEDSGDSGGGDDSGVTDCTARDLVLVAEVRDSAGTAGTSFATTTSLFFAGIIQNPCDADISFDTPTACLVDSWQAVAASGIGMGGGEVCATVITTWTVPAGGALEDDIEWGRLTADTWEMTVDFAGVMPTASTTFTVY